MVPAKTAAMPPPNGIKSNFKNPESYATLLYTVNWVFTLIALTSVLMRTYTRTTLARGHRLGWDDALIVSAICGSIVHAVLLTLALQYGYGRHLWDIPASSFTPSRLRIMTSIEVSYIIAIFLVKVSILVLYRRLFSVDTISRRLTHIGLFFITLVSMAALGIALARTTECDGSEALNIKKICHTQNVNTALIVVGACNTITDFYTLVIPINRILKLRVDSRRKLGVLIIFLGGFIACVMSLVRLIMVIIRSDSPDVFWNGSKVTPFTIVEINLGIICSCLMFTPAFLKKVKAAVIARLYPQWTVDKRWLTIEERGITDDRARSGSDVELVSRRISGLPPILGRLSVPKPALMRVDSYDRQDEQERTQMPWNISRKIEHEANL